MIHFRLLATLVGLFVAYSVSCQAQQAISEKAPSSEIGSAVPIEIGEVVKGRLADSTKTGKLHYWSVNFPVGPIKVVMDLRRSDLSEGNIGGNLDWFTVDGEKLNFSCVPNGIGYRWRTICRLSVQQPLKAVLRYTNGFTVSDYWLGIFKENAQIQSPFFYKSPSVQPMELGETLTATLDGTQALEKDAWYSAKLSAGDYKLGVEYRLASGKVGNVGGGVSMFGPDGDHQSDANIGNAVDVSTKAISRLSLADESTILFRIRAEFAREVITFRLDAVKE